MEQIEKILEERRKVYGDVRENMVCLDEFMNVMCKHAKPPDLDMYNKIGYMGCVNMVFLKLSRIATGNPSKDNFDDACGYLQLAKQILFGEYEK